MSTTPAAVHEVERRKQVRVKLRPDLVVTEQRYEGRTYYVVKDPVSLRYYRFREPEYFLMQLMDGHHTLEDARQRFEARYRPQRLTLEELEQFASQLMETGLALNDMPGSGKAMFQRFRKRRRQTLLRILTNILYIQIPVIDPDRLLDRMIPYVRFIFTLPFFMFSVAFVMAAILLVASHWDTFLARLPAYHEFFSFKTVLYAWVSLGLIKVIHEFGHGLSCKRFGGEVHEMGFLFLCLSPCLYCNVTDAWLLPNKWHRIIIGAAGIYVEVMIAAICTFIWWWAEPNTLLSNLCLTIMVLCSISTVVFNGNPLMRFDGYYVLADWLEIPNLRERSNRYLTNLAMQYCLGIEVPPEPYQMSLGRKILFVTYAITSYLYRWFVTFVILIFLYTFLKPYKLGVISFILGTGALASLVGYPTYRLIRAVKRRGRLPDMKPVRVSITGVIALMALLSVFLIPFPLRVKGLALVQVEPQARAKVVAAEEGSFLEELSVEDGQVVRRGDVIARLKNPDLLTKMELNYASRRAYQEQRADLLAQLVSQPQADALRHELARLESELAQLEHEARELLIRLDRLILRAPRDGKIAQLLPRSELGKLLEPGTLICEVIDDRALSAILLVEPQDRALVVEGQKAWIRIHGLGYNYWRGTVSEIAAVEAKDVPPQLSNKAGGEIPTQEDPEQKVLKPQRQHYLVSVRFDEVADCMHPGVLGRVKIDVGNYTLYWRVRRYLATMFNIGL
ncbi:MAG: HlyD family efflux transporter periplasmic adaptor subunit [Gemmatales bacterium]|nr:HlyD family efflux transporter periplasmic adaptor subunit [Gemmatales bacterium]MDW8221818.1 HlyD family efflux transporter periplasmic adaptor subunit [Gemmatales bacterium]